MFHCTSHTHTHTDPSSEPLSTPGGPHLPTSFQCKHTIIINSFQDIYKTRFSFSGFKSFWMLHSGPFSHIPEHTAHNGATQTGDRHVGGWTNVTRGSWNTVTSGEWLHVGEEGRAEAALIALACFVSSLLTLSVSCGATWQRTDSGQTADRQRGNVLLELVHFSSLGSSSFSLDVLSGTGRR